MFGIEHVAFFFFFFTFGAVIGSFLNVLVLRHESDETLTGRSHCPQCNKQLTWKELVPILSYLSQSGKCVDCGKHISMQYPLVELATALLFPFVYYEVVGSWGVVSVSFFLWVSVALHLFIVSLFVAITVYDWRKKLIPNVFSYTLAGLAFIAMFCSAEGATLPSVVDIFAGPILFAPFYLLWKVSDGRWLGLGDGKLALGIGWFLGLADGSMAVLLSFWIGAGVALLLIGAQKVFKREGAQLGLKSEIPFGPFMVLGTLLVYFFEIRIFSLMII